MLNQVILVGRLIEKIEIEEEKGVLHLAIPRSYKNDEGIYETDFVDCVVTGTIATNTAEYCNKGDIVGVKGRIQTTIEDDTKRTEIIAEKVTFLSTSKKD